jgi:putative hydrolase of HD superfamily
VIDAAVLALLRHGNRLKRTPRTGWVLRGVPDAESVADHSYGVILATMVLAELIGQPVNLGRALAMAALHDLPEALTGDLPRPAVRFLPAGAKPEMERQALAEMVDGLSLGPEWQALWAELHAAQTVEARLVSDADRVDLYLQAAVYGEQTGNRALAEFWARPVTFFFPEGLALYEALRAGRGGADFAD